jgi:hypothetical protein
MPHPQPTVGNSNANATTPTMPSHLHVGYTYTLGKYPPIAKRRVVYGHYNNTLDTNSRVQRNYSGAKDGSQERKARLHLKQAQAKAATHTRPSNFALRSDGWRSKVGVQSHLLGRLNQLQFTTQRDGRKRERGQN